MNSLFMPHKMIIQGSHSLTLVAFILCIDGPDLCDALIRHMASRATPYQYPEIAGRIVKLTTTPMNHPSPALAVKTCNQSRGPCHCALR